MPLSKKKIEGYLKPIVLMIFIGAVVFSLKNLDPSSAVIAKVQGEYNSLIVLFKVYRINNGHFPSTEQGFKALVERPITEPIPHSWSVLSDRIPVDPWNTAYRYTCADPFSKDINAVKISSAGKDGQFGTEDDYILEPVKPPTMGQKIRNWFR